MDRRDRETVTRLGAFILALAIAGGPARAGPPASDQAAPAQPGSTPARDHPEDRPSRIVGFGAELGGSPGLYGAKLGLGALQGGDDVGARRWMVWLEADGTDWFRPRHPADAGRVDQILWVYPHLELSRQLVRRPLLLGWVRAGPTLGRCSVGGGADTLWFPGVAVGAGLLLSPLRIGVTYYGQWRTATVTAASSTASPDVRMEPMVLVTAGLELVRPLER